MSDILKRRSDEKEIEDYLIRLYSNLENYGIDRYKAAELLNENTGQNYDESKWRKDYAHAVKWLSLIHI